MSALLFAPDAKPFAVAALILLGLVGLEVLTLLAGVSLSHLVEKSFDHDGWLDQHIGWLNVGHVPLLVLVMLVLAAFSAGGFALLGLGQALGLPVPGLAAAAAAAVATVPLVRGASRLIARLIPRDETYAVELADFVGRVAEVTVGPLDEGLPGRVRLKDQHGNWHVLRARAGRGEASMAVGQDVILVDRAGDTFVAMPAPDAVRPGRRLS